MNGEHVATSQHARLLVLLAEHMPVVGRHLLSDHPTIECACGNPLYTGHLVVLLAGLNADQPGDLADVSAAVALGRLTDQAFHTAGDDEGRQRVIAERDTVLAALAAQEGDRPSVLPDLALRIEAMPGRGKSQTHLRKSDVLDLIGDVDRKWFAQTVARKGSALAAQEGGQGEAVRAALGEVGRRLLDAGYRNSRFAGALTIVREVRDRRAPETGATPPPTDPMAPIQLTADELTSLAETLGHEPSLALVQWVEETIDAHRDEAVVMASLPPYGDLP